MGEVRRGNWRYREEEYLSANKVATTSLLPLVHAMCSAVHPSLHCYNKLVEEY